MSIDREALTAAARVLYAELSALPCGLEAVDPEGGGNLSMCSVIMRNAIEAYEQAKGDGN